MSDTESFEQALDYETPIMAARCFLHHSKEGDCKPCATYMVDRLRRAHDREIRDTAQQQYHRGYEDGRHSMDAEHAAVAMRLRGLPMNRVEYGANLDDIIEAVCGTNRAGDIDLRDKLIDLMGGVSDGPADDCRVDADSGDSGRDFHVVGVTAYDVLGNERHKAVCELRKLRTDYDGGENGLWEWLEELNDALGSSKVCSLGIIRQRLIHLLGGDRPSGIDVMNSYELRIEKLRRQRDELKRAAKEHADLFESMARDLNDTEAERDELQAKLDAIWGVFDVKP